LQQATQALHRMSQIGAEWCKKGTIVYDHFADGPVFWIRVLIGSMSAWAICFLTQKHSFKSNNILLMRLLLNGVLKGSVSAMWARLHSRVISLAKNIQYKRCLNLSHKERLFLLVQRVKIIFDHLKDFFWFNTAVAPTTSESQRGITCEGLGDVTWSRGTHDIKDPSGKSNGSRMRKHRAEGHQRQHQISK